MEELRGVLLGGLMALAGVIVSGLVTLALQRRQATAPLRIHLFEKQLEAHTAVIRQLGKLHLGVGRLLASRLVPGADVTGAARELNALGIETMAVLDEQTFYLDRTAGEAIIGFVALANQIRDGADVSAEQVGVEYGRAVATCQAVLSIPELANATFREARSGRHRRAHGSSSRSER